MSQNETRPEEQLPSRRVANDLRQAITSGSLAAGARLPSERSLADQYGVARNTAREAVRLLATEGLVTSHHGKGVFVRGKQRLLRFGSQRYSHRVREETGLSPYRAEVSKQGRTARVDCTSISSVQPPAEIAERLGLDLKDDAVIRRES